MAARRHAHVPDGPNAAASATPVAGRAKRVAGVPPTIEAVRALQRQIGNRATARLLATDLPEPGTGSRAAIPTRRATMDGDPREPSDGPVLRRILQRKKLTRGKLNVAGESHPESGPRRANERTYAAEQTGGDYWTEGEFTAKPSVLATARLGDPLMLRAEMLLAILKEKSVPLFLAPFGRGEIPAAFPQDGDAASLWGIYKARLHQDVMEIVLAIARASSDPSESTEAQKAEGTHGAMTALAALIQRTDVGGAAGIATAATDAIALFARDVLNAADIRSEAVVSDLRSQAMHGAARDEGARWVGGKTGLWKVGNQHVAEMQAVKGTAAYEIMTRDEFNADFDPWLAARPAP